MVRICHILSFWQTFKGVVYCNKVKGLDSHPSMIWIVSKLSWKQGIYFYCLHSINTQTYFACLKLLFLQDMLRSCLLESDFPLMYDYHIQPPPSPTPLPIHPPTPTPLHNMLENSRQDGRIWSFFYFFKYFV